MTGELLPEIVAVTGIAVVVAGLCHAARLPSIVGFLLTGALCGPHGLRVVGDVHGTEVLAEFGVVALLFTIGLEFSLQRLWEIRTPFVVGGSAQVLVTVAAMTAISMRMGQPPGQAMFMGFLVALSSTALVLSLLQRRAETHSPHGHTSLAILLYQDTIVIVMMLFTPALAGAAHDVIPTLARLAAVSLALLVVGWFAARWAVPWLLYQVIKVRDREVFVLSVVFLVCAATWVTLSAGLSLALGAFLAGLIISESPYSHRVLGSILPFRDVFTSFFFIATGMMLNGGYVLANAGWVIPGALALMLLKTATGAAAVLLLGWPLRTAILTGLALSQIGEFSFVLYHAGVQHGLVGEELRQPFLAMSVITMVLTPIVMGLGPRLADAVSHLPLSRPRQQRAQAPAETSDADALRDHLVIVGFGLNGRNLARAARASNIPYAVVEINPDTVREERRNKEPIHYGDATHESVLGHVGIERARVAVVAISDAAATRRTTELIRRLSPSCHIIVRTRFASEVAALHQLGADEVVPEEFETSIEIFARVLHKYLVPRAEIERFIAEVRSDAYGMLRSLSLGATPGADLTSYRSGVEISALKLCAGSHLAGLTLAEADLSRLYGVTVLVVHREGTDLTNPTPDTVLQAEDVIVVMGEQSAVAELARVCEAPRI